MTIETKYNIGDEVWFLFNGEPLNGKVARISEYTIKVTVIFKDGKEYLFGMDIKGAKLFPTKEELLKSLQSMRESKIKEIAKYQFQYVGSANVNEAFASGIITGAKWADDNPNWIRPIDEMPNLKRRE